MSHPEERALKAGRQAFASALWQLTGTFFLPRDAVSGRCAAALSASISVSTEMPFTSSSPRRLCALPPTVCYPWERPFSTTNGFPPWGKENTSKSFSLQEGRIVKDFPPKMRWLSPQGRREQVQSRTQSASKGRKGLKGGSETG